MKKPKAKSAVEEIASRTMNSFDLAVMKLSRSEYKDLLEDVIDRLEGRLEAMKEEMGDAK